MHAQSKTDTLPPAQDAWNYPSLLPQKRKNDNQIHYQLPPVKQYSSQHQQNYQILPYAAPTTTWNILPWNLYGPRVTPYIVQPSTITSRSSYSPTINAPNPLVRTEGFTPTTINTPVSAPSNPRSVRSLKRSQTKLAPQTSLYQAPTFNPYSQYPDTKADLKLVGNLTEMCQNWNQSETSAHRRLVEFSRLQTGSTINATFKAVSPEERDPKQLCLNS
jgi:hypothetical protein